MDKPTRERQPAQTRPAMRNAIVLMCYLPGITKNDLKVGMVILELTAGHGKLQDRICRAEIARRAGVCEKTVTRALKKFAGIFEWVPARGPGHLGTIRLRNAGEIMPTIPGLERDVWMSRVQPTSELAPVAEQTRDKTVPTTEGYGIERGTREERTRDKSASDAGQIPLERETRPAPTRDKCCPTTSFSTALDTSVTPPRTSETEFPEEDFERKTHHEEDDEDVVSGCVAGRGSVDADAGQNAIDRQDMFRVIFQRHHADDNGIYWINPKTNHANSRYRDELFDAFSLCLQVHRDKFGASPRWIAWSVISRNILVSDLDAYVLDALIADSWTRLAKLQDDQLARGEEPGWWLARQVELEEQGILIADGSDDRAGWQFALPAGDHDEVASFVEHFDSAWGRLTDEERARVENLAIAGLASGEDPCDLEWKLVNGWEAWIDDDKKAALVDEVF